MTELDKKQRHALEQFAALAISIEDLSGALRGVMQFEFGAQERRVKTYFRTPEPGVRIELKHIWEAMDKHARGEITTQQLSDWAAMLLLNDAYDWEGHDEDEIADWLNEISNLTLKPKADSP